MASDFERDFDAAMDRLRRARDRGTGCHLTADMISALGTSKFGEAMEETPNAIKSHSS